MSPAPPSVGISALEPPRVPLVPPASPERALAHFSSLLEFETDCHEVHHDLATTGPAFVLVDVREPEAYVAGHIPGAVNLPLDRIDEESLGRWSPDTLFVVYGRGPHCRAADRAAVRLSRSGRSVKRMLGGIQGWRESGYELTTEPSSAGALD